MRYALIALAILFAAVALRTAYGPQDEATAELAAPRTRQPAEIIKDPLGGVYYWPTSTSVTLGAGTTCSTGPNGTTFCVYSSGSGGGGK